MDGSTGATYTKSLWHQMYAYYAEISWISFMDWRVIATGVGAFLLVRLLAAKKTNYPPHPPKWPLIGNLLEFRSGNIFEVLIGLANKYGKNGLLTIYLGPKPCIILYDIEAVRLAFLKFGNEFADRPIFYTLEAFSDNYQSILAGNLTPRWKVMRKIAHTALRKFASGDVLENLLHSKTAEGLAEIQELAETATPFDIYPKISTMVYGILLNMVFGKDMERNDPFYVNLIKELDEFNEALGNGFFHDIFPILRHFPNPIFDRVMKTFAEIKTIVKESWEEHEANYDPDDLRDFVGYMLSAKEQVSQEDEGDTVNELTYVHYSNILLDMFFAGTDTSRMTLNWVVALTVKHPDIQAKMHDELDAVLGSEPVRLQHRARLPYTEAVLHEAMRLYPVAPLGMPHATAQDVHIGEYDIPRGTMVMPSIWSLHHDPEQWLEPHVFRPERHLDESGKLAPKPNSFLPFSTGRRVCVGEAFAKAELHMLTAMLFQRFSFHAPPEKEFKIEMIPGMVCLPKSYNVVAKLRT